MSKLYTCAKGCGSVEETDSKKVPTCCGCAMVEISEDQIFGCGGGCCSCCAGCGPVEDVEAKKVSATKKKVSKPKAAKTVKAVKAKPKAKKK